ncbi:MAG TPA: hypothetical protein VI757_07945 [Bacteroidia bacterium]|nr:hypothetical protein [Bacteroidia bacterium]
MNVSSITLYNVLKLKLGDSEAQAVVEGIKEAVREEFDTAKDILLTKQDKVELIEKIAQSKLDMIKWMVGFWIVQMAAIIGLYLK